MDIVFDIIVSLHYYNSVEQEFAGVTLTFIVLNLTMQLICIQKRRPLVPSTSLISSVMFTAGRRTQISFDMDTERRKRERSLSFYVFVRIDRSFISLLLTLLFLFLASVCNLLVRSLTFVSLAKKGSLTLVMIYS